MKINYKKMITWLLIIALIIILPDISRYYQRYKLRAEKLPETYQTYTQLDSLKDDLYEVIKMDCESSEPIIQDSDSTIVIICRNHDPIENADTTESMGYKINLRGEIQNISINQNKGKELKYDESTYDVSQNSGTIRRVFVHKEVLLGNSFWNIRKNLRWGTGNSSGGNVWTGTSYFEMRMPQKKLHFKQFVGIDQNGHLNDRFFYFLYKPKGAAYLLLNDTQNRRYYLIRPKITSNNENTAR